MIILFFLSLSLSRFEETKFRTQQTARKIFWFIITILFFLSLYILRNKIQNSTNFYNYFFFFHYYSFFFSLSIHETKFTTQQTSRKIFWFIMTTLFFSLSRFGKQNS